MPRKKILVIRFSAIGDIVLTTPVIRCIKKQLDAEVHFLTKDKFERVLEGNPYIDRVLTIRKSVTECADEIRETNYDFVVDLHHNLRSMQVKRLVPAPSSSFPKLNIEKWVLVNLKFNWLPGLHIVDRYLKTVKKLGVVDDGAGLDYFFNDAHRAEASAFLPKTPCVAIAIGAGLKTKCLEADQIAALAEGINHPVVLLGGPDDIEMGEQIAKAVRNVVNIAGKVSLGASAATLAQCGLLITPDTGLMHIAAALDKPVISVWGNTVPEFGMTPFYPRQSSTRHKACQVGALSCRPCSKIGYDTCPKGHFKCIREIPLKDIIDVAHAWMAG